MTGKGSPLERDEFKLLTPNERKFIENPTDSIRTYKNQDAMIRQFNNRIKYRAINAISEIAWLCDKLPQKRLVKIFTDERIVDLFNITDKAVDVADWNMPVELNNRLLPENLKRTSILRDHVKNLMPCFLSPSEITDFDDLMEKYVTFAEISNEISNLNSEISHCLRKSNLLSEFIKNKGLEEEFESYQSEVRERNNIAFRALIESFKSAGHNFTDEEIDSLITRFSKD